MSISSSSAKENVKIERKTQMKVEHKMNHRNVKNSSILYSIYKNKT